MSDSKPNGDSIEEGIPRDDFALLVHDHLNEYIKLADNKASILLSALVAYIGISLGILGSHWPSSGAPFKVMSSVTVLTALAAVYYAAGAVYPNTPETPQGLILWDSIVKKSRKEYQKEIFEKPERKLLEELIDENYKLAEVSVGKYSQVRNALIWTGVTVSFALITVVAFLI